MKLCVKRIRCPYCGRLTNCREQKIENGNIQVTCNKCGKQVYVWNGLRWVPVREAA